MSWQPPPGPPPPEYGSPPGHPPQAPYPPSGHPAQPGYPPAGHPPQPGYPPGPYPQGATPWGPAPGLAYATFWRRLGGYVIDVLILGVVLGVVFGILFAADISNWATQVSNATQAGLPAPKLVLSADRYLVFGLIGVVVTVLYFGVLVGSWGSTVGQRAVGVRVVRQEDTARRLPQERSLLRAIAWWGPGLLGLVTVLGSLPSLLTFLALLWAAWDPRKQGLHDKLGRALVVRDAPLPAVLPYGQPVYSYMYPGPSPPGPPPGPPLA